MIGGLVQTFPNSMAALADAPLIELYIFGDPVPTVALSHVRALNGLLEIKIMNALIEVEHVEIIAALPSLRVVQGRFASQQVVDRLSTLRPDLRGF